MSWREDAEAAPSRRDRGSRGNAGRTPRLDAMSVPLIASVLPA
jgi:hypothetical protein